MRRATLTPAVTHSLWAQWRRSTTALGSVFGAAWAALTATSFTWREHVAVKRSNGKELSNLDGCSCAPQAGAGARVPMGPTVLEATKDIPATATSATAGRMIALAGGSHAEH